MILPPLPGKNDLIEISLNNVGLSEQEYQLIFKNPLKKVKIAFEGTQNVLNFLIQQLSQFRTNPMELSINKCFIDHTVCLPFSELNNRTRITFGDNPTHGSGFNEYIMNCNSAIYNQILLRLNLDTRCRIVSEKAIQKEFLQNMYNELDKLNKRIDGLTNQQKMDFFFQLIYRSFPYDTTITNPDGSWRPESTELGGTAQVVYERGKGICEGRSKLLKLVTNNDVIKLPCYIVDGKFGKDGHVWNEFITDDGRVIVYDLSTHLKCSFDGFEQRYPQYHNIIHEVPVERALKINKY